MSKSKYKYANGQAVRVKDNIEPWTNYFMKSGPKPDIAYASSGGKYNRSPCTFCGEIVHISHKANGCYKIMEDDKENYYTDEMLEPIKPFFCKSLL